MGSWLSVLLILLILLTGGYLYLRKKGRLPTWLSSSSTTNSTQTISKIETHIELEEKKAEELRAVLSAKQKLARAKAINSALRREIGSTSESTIIISRNELLEKKDGKEKEKVHEA